jgi:hypothetical protein
VVFVFHLHVTLVAELGGHMAAARNGGIVGRALGFGPGAPEQFAESFIWEVDSFASSPVTAHPSTNSRGDRIKAR